MAILRRAIDELIALYSLEPSVRDVFVEGKFDRDLISWFLKAKDKRHVTVAEISTIDINDALVKTRGFPVGSNKSRLMVLAGAVEEALGSIDQLTCVVDADFDAHVEPYCECPLLLRTDFAFL